MKKVFVIILLALASNAFSQDWPLKKIVTEKKVQKTLFVHLPAFTLIGNKAMERGGNYQMLKLNSSFTKQLLGQRPDALQLSIPLSTGENLDCDLVKVSLGNIKFTENNDKIIEDVKIPVTYRGIVSGESNKNTVVLTVNEDYLSLVATLNDKTIQVSKGEETDKSSYRLYNSKYVQFPQLSVDCGTPDKAPGTTSNGISLSGIQSSKTAAPQNKCISVFIDCFDSLYQWKSKSTQQTLNFVYELFNEVAAGYVNEQINVEISTINIWTTPDPYRGDNRANALADLAANYKDSFWGNICVGMDYSLNSPSSRSGLAGEIGKVKGVAPKICPAYAVGSNEFCYTDLNYNVTVKNFPVGPNTTGQQVYIVMHEIGHLLGAHHTKWCGWKLGSNPDVYGALDSCGGMEAINSTTPVCATGPPPPASGATIMSYCVSGNTPSQFVNYNNGFGTLPGNAIRNFVDQNACIPACLVCLTSANDRLKDISFPERYLTAASGIKNNNQPIAPDDKHIIQNIKIKL